MRDQTSDRDIHGAIAAACRGKDPLTWAQAKAIKDRHKGKRRSRKLTIYHCKFCQAWHIGTSPRWRKRRLK